MNKIIKIDRHRMGTDGSGISTLVVFHGCPLNCEYCINDFCHRDDILVRTLSANKLVEELSVDDIYFRMSGGGIVFGGGEPILNSYYIEEVIQKAPSEWQFRIETSLNASWEHVERLIPYIDQWIIDIKDLNPDIYKRYTGLDNSLVIENSIKLSKYVSKCNILFRIPKIPNYNNETDIEKSVSYFEKLGITECFDYINTKEKQLPVAF